MKIKKLDEWTVALMAHILSSFQLVILGLPEMQLAAGVGHV